MICGFQHLGYAFALTAHRSQGGTFDNVLSATATLIAIPMMAGGTSAYMWHWPEKIFVLWGQLAHDFNYRCWPWLKWRDRSHHSKRKHPSARLSCSKVGSKNTYNPALAAITSPIPRFTFSDAGGSWRFNSMPGRRRCFHFHFWKDTVSG